MPATTSRPLNRLKPVWTFEPSRRCSGRAAVLGGALLRTAWRSLPTLSNSFGTTPKDCPSRKAGCCCSQCRGGGRQCRRCGILSAGILRLSDFERSRRRGTALERLKAILAENFPPAMPQVRLERAARLIRGGQATRARREYAAMAVDFGGVGPRSGACARRCR